MVKVRRLQLLITPRLPQELWLNIMPQFRMSMKSDKGESKNHHSVISIPQKDAIAIIPPKKVSLFTLFITPDIDI